MRSRPLPIIAFLLLTATSTAQTLTGPRIGLGLATQSVGGLFQNTSNLLPRPVLGWCWAIPVHRQVYIQPEILWVSKGYTSRNPQLATRDRAIFKYIEVPLMAMIQTDASEDGLFLSVGLVTGYKVAGKYTQWTNGDVTNDVKYDLNGTTNRWDFSPAVGMGWRWDHWTFEARAQTSITPFEATLQVQNILYAFNFTYLFEAGKRKE